MPLFPRLTFLRGRFVRDTMTLTAGLVAAQALTLLTAPLLTRIYTPAEFGIFSTWFTQVVGISSIICLAYETAIVLPETDGEAVTLLGLCLLITAALSGVVLLGVLFFRDAIGVALNAPGLSSWLWAAPAMLALMGSYQALNYWGTRKQLFRQISITRVVQTGATVGTQVAGAGLGGLIVGVIAGQGLASAVLIGSTASGVREAWRQARPTAASMWEQAYRYRQFPLYASWGTFMISGSFQVVPLLLSSQFSPTVAGFYFLVYRLASVPMSFLGSSIGQVLLQRSATTLARGEPVADLVEQAIGKLIQVAALPFLVLAFVAPPLFGSVFGQQWSAAGHFLRIMTPLFFCQFVTGPVSAVLIAMRRQRAAAMVQSAMLVGAVGSLVAGARIFGSPALTLALYCLVQCSIYVVYLGLVVHYAHASPRRIARQALSLKGLV